MLWVDVHQTTYMNFLGYSPEPEHWFVHDRNGYAVNGYPVPREDMPRVEQVLSNARIYHHR